MPDMPANHDTHRGLHVLLLAAGGADRMGSPKQLLEFRGETLVRRALRAATTATRGQVTVILGAASRQIEPQLEGLDCTSVFNPEWRNGLASSIRQGLLTLPAARQAVLLIPCDMPLLDARALSGFARQWQQDRSRIIAADTGGHPGIPAIVPRRYFKALMSIKGDSGMRNFFARHRSCCDVVKGPEFELDVDTPRDLKQMEEAAARRPD